MFGIMGRKIGAREVKLMTQGGHRSWEDLGHIHVAKELTAELDEMCPVCIESLYERVPPEGTDARLVGHPKDCCGRMYYRRCMAAWVTRKHLRGQEVNCPSNPNNIALARYLFPVQDEDKEQHLSYLQEREQGHFARRRTSFTEEKSTILADSIYLLLEHRAREENKPCG